MLASIRGSPDIKPTEVSALNGKPLRSAARVARSAIGDACFVQPAGRQQQHQHSRGAGLHCQENENTGAQTVAVSLGLSAHS